MMITIVATIILIAASILFHYEALRLLSSGIERMRGNPRSRLLLVLSGVLVAHIIEILAFAVGYYLLQLSGVGGLDGTVTSPAFDSFYISASSYTTLGMGDLFPIGPLRILSSIESLLGLVLIGWSTSFTYLAMRDLWTLH